MSGTMFVNHHAEFARCDDETTASKPDRDWSGRAKLACLVGCSLASWAVVLVPIFLLA